MPSPKTGRKAAIREKKIPAAQTRMGRLRESNTDTSSAFYQERRREIVDAAAQVFREHGFMASNFGMIADKLGTDRASIYYYFGSKKELFQEVVREVADQTVRTAEAIAARDARAPEKLREAFQAVMKTYSSSYPYMHVFLQENLSEPATVEDDWRAEGLQWTTRYYDAIRRIIQQGVDEGSLQANLPVGLMTMGVLGTVNWAHRWYRPGGALSPEAIADGFAQMLIDGMAAGRAAPAPTAG